MTTLARLSFWVPPGHLETFAAVYEDRLLPLLEKQAWVASTQPGRTAVSGIFSRLFAFATSTAFLTAQQTLAEDGDWRAIRGELGAIFGNAGSDNLLPYNLAPYTTPAGVGQTIVVGLGFRQGLWQSFGIQDGLLASAICAILSDREGTLWLGTDSGVCRCAEDNFTWFTTADGLADSKVEAILEDRSGHLWFGTAGGLSRYDGTHFTTFTTADGLADSKVEAILEDRSGHLWFGTAGGLSRYDGTHFTTFTTADGLAYDGVRAILEDRDGQLWISTVIRGTKQGALNRYDGQTFTTFTTADGLADNRVSSILEDRHGQLWIGTWGGGVSRYDGTRFTTFTAADGLTNNRVVDILEDRAGHLWFGTWSGGVNRYDGQTFTALTTADGLVSDHITTMAEDRAGDLWIGTYNGISRYTRAQFTHFTAAEGLASNLVQTIAQDRSGQLWFGSFEGVSRYDGQTIVNSTEELDRFGVVKDILEDRHGALWIADQLSGLWRYDDRTWTRSTTGEGLGDNGVWCILEDRAGQLWFGTYEGVSRYDGQQFTNYTVRDGLAPGAVISLLEDRAGQLWFGTWGGGVSRYDGQGFTTLTAADGLPYDGVHAMVETRDGQLWFGTGVFGTSQGALSHYDGSQFTTFTAADGLPRGVVMALLEDQTGSLWIGTWDGGASRFDGLVFQHLSRRDGLIQDTVQDLFEDRDGAIWIATEGGLTRYKPSRTIPTVRLTHVIADRRYAPDQPVRLPVSQQLIVFEFQGTSGTTHPNGMAYVYRLKGLEADRQTTYEGRVEYNELPTGEYIFEVQAVDRDLNYSAAATVAITIEPDRRVEALTQALNAAGATGEFVGHSAGLRQVQTELAQVAPTDETVLILGETGTGKGLAARLVHSASPRRSESFITVSCGALPKDLVESELFGHERGAFTGATSRQLGKVDVAQGGTLFLDEIGDMPLDAQVKLLRLLEERQFERVGGTETLAAQVRIVAATNRDLAQMVEKGRFREDLYFRLRVFEVVLPLLRERREDIPLLAVYFAQRMATHLGKPVQGFSPQAERALLAYRWPGNVRELEHAVRRAVVVCTGETIHVEDLALERRPEGPASDPALITLEEHDRRYIQHVLAQTGGAIRGAQGAAAILGIKPTTLYSRMKKLGIKPTARRNID
ncbi:MAG: AAA domain-containing protein [Candidatus Latescibacteria bacterium]|nr:AAA domain-containing protein [Candidatus Latescibacterota bacterium]